jgi:hypothetical protein
MSNDAFRGRTPPKKKNWPANFKVNQDFILMNAGKNAQATDVSLSKTNLAS